MFGAVGDMHFFFFLKQHIEFIPEQIRRWKICDFPKQNGKKSKCGRKIMQIFSLFLFCGIQEKGYGNQRGISFPILS